MCAAKRRKNNRDEVLATADYMADLDQIGRVLKGYQLALERGSAVGWKKRKERVWDRLRNYRILLGKERSLRVAWSPRQKEK